MAASEDSVELKRKADNNSDGDGDAEDDEWVGPMPSEATKAKKRKGLFSQFDSLYHIYLIGCLSSTMLVMLTILPLAFTYPGFASFQCSNLNVCIWTISLRLQCMNEVTCTEMLLRTLSVPSKLLLSYRLCNELFQVLSIT